MSWVNRLLVIDIEKIHGVLLSEKYRARNGTYNTSTFVWTKTVEFTNQCWLWLSLDDKIMGNFSPLLCILFYFLGIFKGSQTNFKCRKKCMCTHAPHIFIWEKAMSIIPGTPGARPLGLGRRCMCLSLGQWWPSWMETSASTGRGAKRVS